MKIVATAAFSLEGDDSGFIYQGSVVRHEGQLWLVATWLEGPAGTERIPEWLVPLDGLVQSGSEHQELLALKRPLPKGLAHPGLDPQALQRAGAVRNPVLAPRLDGDAMH